MNCFTYKKIVNIKYISYLFRFLADVSVNNLRVKVATQCLKQNVLKDKNQNSTTTRANLNL